MTKLEKVLKAIDEVNATDPKMEDSKPANLLYGQRMSEELDRLFPEASEVLKIAVRGQHIERWIIPRNTYPEGKVGYLKWRRDLAGHHAERIGKLMSEAGYGEIEIAAAGRMLRKEGIKRDSDVQALEDVICFVFLKWYFKPFAAKHTEEKIQEIVKKTARKMSEEGRKRVLQEFNLPEKLAEAFKI